jgi:uncharacterized protein YuzE
VAFTFDREANALYIKLSDNKIVETLSLGNNVYMDIDSDNRAVGLEILLSEELDTKTLEVLQNSSIDNIESQMEQSFADLKSGRFKEFTIDGYRKELRKRFGLN